MRNVTLAIGGRNFALACPDGEEAHLADLGRMVDARVAQGGTSSQSETRMLLYAALMLADELHEANRQLAASGAPALPSEDVHFRVARIAERLEALAQRLEEPGTKA